MLDKIQVKNHCSSRSDVNQTISNYFQLSPTQNALKRTLIKLFFMHVDWKLEKGNKLAGRDFANFHFLIVSIYYTMLFHA